MGSFEKSREECTEPPARIVIEALAPEIDGGRFPIKRIAGEEVEISVDIFAEGHDKLAAVIKYRYCDDNSPWREAPLTPIDNDRWRGSFIATEVGLYQYTVEAWVDRYSTWCEEISKKHVGGQELTREFLEGSILIRHSIDQISTEKENSSDRKALLTERAEFLTSDASVDQRVAAALSPELISAISRSAPREALSRYSRMLEIRVERKRALYGAWYEMFPRSVNSDGERHATFRDAEVALPQIAAMGFDVLYLPPIHPIGYSYRKGPNNALTCNPGDPGCPWAIGSHEGGHNTIHPLLGNFEDFDHFRGAAEQLGLELAIDIAFQCSPDHPYVAAHPEWFRHSPDGTIKYAENPPKKYQDIYPLNFASAEWSSLWRELKELILFWIDKGVKIFRVDNPHTKPFCFWEWLIGEIWQQHREVIFLSEAFTRPKVMKYLAKCGFSQSYTYFTWRNTKSELESYLTSLAHSDTAEYMRPNLFVNTPDILHEYLQFGGRASFQARLVLAATLGASYGIYGPPFELCEGRAYGKSEEYLDSEKYQLRSWQWDQPGNIKDFIAKINRIRRENGALHEMHNLSFYPIDNEQMIFYGKVCSDFSNIILVVVNLDPHHQQSGWVKMPLVQLGLDEESNYEVHDLISEECYLWHGERNFVQLDPQRSPAHIFRLRRKIKTERDFDYFF